jgi:acetyl/propionyl-CoA carboxylase alpha subunit
MIAKVMARGQTREEALTRLARALEETRIQVEGGTTNLPFLRFWHRPRREAETWIQPSRTQNCCGHIWIFRDAADSALIAAGICEHRKREREASRIRRAPMITGT